MQTTPHVIKILAATIALLLTAQATVLATTTKRNGGPVTALRSVTADEPVEAESADFIPVDGMDVTMGVPSGEQALLVITFSGVSYCVDIDGVKTASCIVQVFVDGAPAAPGSVWFDTARDGGGYEANSMQFVAGPLGPGQYTVRVKARIDEPGTFAIGHRTLTVLRSRV